MPTPADPVILALETSNPTSGGPARNGALALGLVDPSLPRGFRLLARERLPEAARHDEALLPAIDRACRRVGVTPRSIARVAVSIGPGGFSSVRVAVATAQMICEAAGAQPVPVPTALAVALGSARSAPRRAVALSGKRDSAWITVFDRPSSGQECPPGALLGADALAALHARAPIDALVADEHIPAPFHAWARGAGVRIAPPRFSAARVLEASLARSPVDPALLLPLYPREPEAAARWREREPRP